MLWQSIITALRPPSAHQRHSSSLVPLFSKKLCICCPTTSSYIGKHSIGFVVINFSFQEKITQLLYNLGWQYSLDTSPPQWQACGSTVFDKRGNGEQAQQELSAQQILVLFCGNLVIRGSTALPLHPSPREQIKALLCFLFLRSFIYVFPLEEM